MLSVLLTVFLIERPFICEINSLSFWESVDFEGASLAVSDLERERALLCILLLSFESLERDLPLA